LNPYPTICAKWLCGEKVVVVPTSTAPLAWPRSGRTPSVFRENLCSRQWGPYGVTGYWCHVKLDLKVRPFYPLHVKELSDADMNVRKYSCRALLAAFRSQRARGTALFTDECAIYRSVHSRNIVFWAKENPHFYDELERNPPHVMLWAGLSATHMFGPFFFQGSVTGQA
jgi:hypothetical protein